MPGKLSVVRALYGTVIAVVCLVLQLLVFVLVVIGTPLDSFRYKVGDTAVTCLSMWGRREKCNKIKLVKVDTYKGMGCSSSEKVMTAAGAFAIVSIPCSLLAAIFCILLICKCCGGGCLPGIFAVITFVCTLICWACQVGGFHRQCKYTVAGVSVKSLSLSKSGYKLSASPALFITAWCLEFFVCLLIFIL